jgi:hypothetical protein
MVIEREKEILDMNYVLDRLWYINNEKQIIFGRWLAHRDNNNCHLL